MQMDVCSRCLIWSIQQTNIKHADYLNEMKTILVIEVNTHFDT